MQLTRGELTDIIEAVTAFNHHDEVTKGELLNKLELMRATAEGIPED